MGALASERLLNRLRQLARFLEAEARIEIMA
jgi:hypothetical protein